MAPRSSGGGTKLSTLTPAAVLEGGALPLAGELLLLVRNALERLAAGQVLEVRSRAPEAQAELSAWAKLQQHTLLAVLDAAPDRRLFLEKGPRTPELPRPDWAQRLPLRPDGSLDLRDWLSGRAGELPAEAPAYLGFVPRGAVLEPGAPDFPYLLNRKSEVWSAMLPQLCEQAKAQQWNASTDIPWARLTPLPDAVERAVCQLMTFLAENEYAALYIPAKFLPRINAQYLEAVLFLSGVINDEARHIEAFTKRALANGGGLQYASALTERSLHSLLVQEDYFRSTFLLHVLGEGTFLDLLAFIERHAPDPATAEVVRRARADEGRHVAYGVAHVAECLLAQPARAEELVAAAAERFAALQSAGDSNPQVLEALAVLAGGGSAPERVGRGFAAVRALYRRMDEHRVQRMLQLGLPPAVAAKISELHTPNFM